MHDSLLMQSSPSQKRPLSNVSSHFLQTPVAVNFGAVSGHVETHFLATESQSRPPSAVAHIRQLCVSGTQTTVLRCMSAHDVQTLPRFISGQVCTHLFAVASQNSPPSSAEHSLHLPVFWSKIGMRSGQSRHWEFET